MFRSYIKGIGMLVGLIFGAGIFALPYVIIKAGIFWGVFHFVVAGALILLLHFLYAEIAFFTPGRHRFPGYVRLFLGKRAEQLAFLVTLAAYYGTLLAYGILGGLFLSNFWEGKYAFLFSIIFLLVGSILVYLNIGKIAMINFYLTLPILGFVVYLFFIALPFINLGNFSLSFETLSFNPAWFLPYGIWLFSLGGFAVIPEVRDIFAVSSLKKFKRTIFLSLILVSVFYWLFILSIAGVSGVMTSQDAFSGILNILGKKAVWLGSLIGLLAVFTSFLALGLDLKYIFQFDVKISKVASWFLVTLPPILLLFLGINNFARILGIIGTLGLGVTGVFIILMAKKQRRITAGADLIKVNSLIGILSLLAILVAVVYEIYYMLK